MGKLLASLGLLAGLTLFPGCQSKPDYENIYRNVYNNIQNQKLKSLVNHIHEEGEKHTDTTDKGSPVYSKQLTTSSGNSYKLVLIVGNVHTRARFAYPRLSIKEDYPINIPIAPLYIRQTNSNIGLLDVEPDGQVDSVFDVNKFISGTMTESDMHDADKLRQEDYTSYLEDITKSL